MATKPFVFTLMPFSSDFDDIYQLGIKKTAVSLGAYCERVDEQIYDGTILDRILNQITKADVIVADMTGKNPNVFFEVGYAKGINKKIILLTKTANDIPFDLKHYPHIVYENSITNLREYLKRPLQHHLSKLDASSEEFQLGVNLKINGITLTPNEETIIPFKEGQMVRVSYLSIYNSTTSLIKGNKLQIGVIGENLDNILSEVEKKRVVLSEEETMYLYTHPTSIFPQGWASILLCGSLGSSSGAGTIRIFTENGSFDFMFKEVMTVS